MEKLLGLAHFAALQVANLCRQALYPRSHHGQGAEKRRVTVPRNDLCGDHFDDKAKLFGHEFLNPRVHMGKGAHSAADRAHRNLSAGRNQPGTVAAEFGVMTRQLQPEAGRFRMNAVAAADRGGVLEFERPRLQRRQHGVDIGNQDIGRLGQLHRKTGVQHVRAGHAEMHEAAVLAHAFGQPGQERDHVMPRHLLDGVDPIEVVLRDMGHLGAAPAANVRGCLGRYFTDPRHALGGKRLDLEPYLEPVFRRPDGCHRRAAVTRNHWLYPSLLLHDPPRPHGAASQPRMTNVRPRVHARAVGAAAGAAG